MKESVKKFLHGFRQMFLVTIVLMLICGLLFPCLLTGLSSLFFPHQADGSLITVNGQTVGAETGVHQGLLYVEPSFCLSL